MKIYVLKNGDFAKKLGKIKGDQNRKDKARKYGSWEKGEFDETQEHWGWCYF